MHSDFTLPFLDFLRMVHSTDEVFQQSRNPTKISEITTKSGNNRQYHLPYMIILWKIIWVISMLKIVNGFRIENWQTAWSFTAIYRILARWIINIVVISGNRTLNGSMTTSWRNSGEKAGLCQRARKKEGTYYLSASEVVIHRREQAFVIYKAVIMPIMHSLLSNKGARIADSLLVYICCHFWLYFWAAMTTIACQFGATLREKSHSVSNGIKNFPVKSVKKLALSDFVGWQPSAKTSSSIFQYA